MSLNIQEKDPVTGELKRKVVAGNAGSGEIKKERSLNNNTQIKLFAHRGMAQLAPDCSKPAWEWTKRLGYYGLEVDIWSSSDNVFVVYHDPNIDDLTNGTGKVTELTWEEISQAEYDTGALIDNYPHLHISRIEELFAWVKQNNMPTLLDVKTIHSYTELTQMIVEWGLEDLCIICTQSEEAIKDVRAISDKVYLRYWSAGTMKEMADVASQYSRCDFSVWMGDVTREGVEYAHSKGVRVGTYPYNTECEKSFEYYRLANMGVDTCTVNAIVNNNDFGNCETQMYSALEPQNFYGWCEDNFEQKTTLAELESDNTSGKCFYYKNGNLIVNRKNANTNISASLQKAIYAEVGDVIEVNTRQKWVYLGSTPSRKQRASTHITYYVYRDINSSTSASAINMMIDPTNRFNDINTGIENYQDWHEVKSFYIVPESGVYHIETGNTSDDTQTINYVSKFDIKVHKTGQNINGKKVLLKRFEAKTGDITTETVLHRATTAFKELEILVYWDSLYLTFTIPAEKDYSNIFGALWNWNTGSSTASFYEGAIKIDYKISGKKDAENNLYFNTLVVTNNIRLVSDTVGNPSTSSRIGIKEIYGIL